jgi:hypothetical protein
MRQYETDLMLQTKITNFDFTNMTIVYRLLVKGGDCRIPFCFSKFSACQNDFLKEISTRILSFVLYLLACEGSR